MSLKATHIPPSYHILSCPVLLTFPLRHVGSMNKPNKPALSRIDSTHQSMNERIHRHIPTRWTDSLRYRPHTYAYPICFRFHIPEIPDDPPGNPSSSSSPNLSTSSSPRHRKTTGMCELLGDFLLPRLLLLLSSLLCADDGIACTVLRILVPRAWSTSV